MVDWGVRSPWHRVIVVVAVVCGCSWTNLLEFMLVDLWCICETWREIGKLKFIVKVLEQKLTKNFDDKLSHWTCQTNFHNEFSQ